MRELAIDACSLCHVNESCHTRMTYTHTKMQKYMDSV